MGKAKVLVGMSGGIDSSVAAYLLREEGYDIQGVTMTLWKHGDSCSSASLKGDACFSPNEKNDVEKSRSVCRSLGISHFVLDIADCYERIVLRNFKDEYVAGRTPNPCVLCNEKIKFGALVEAARAKGVEFDFFATGHYARIVSVGKRLAVAKAADPLKDQSYFLYRLHQKQLNGVLFPLGEMTKSEVRKIDVKLGFHPEGQSESMDFYSGDYADLLDISPKKGNIVDVSGKVLGQHDGYWNYTIGQRRGIGIGGSEQPLYVLSIDPARNEITVGSVDQAQCGEVVAADLSFMGLDEHDADSRTRSALVKIRSAGKPSSCRFSISKGQALIKFESPAFSPCCGQSAVAYDEDGVVLFGGVIESVGGNSIVGLKSGN
ncbi:MAG TPA: tRNA 2-thiouridine(34) synthase MnmA [Spirochaetaceae bacterium]|nr:tRNA 2-thiouridine(34) synthase MnmA [Spirochaetaceae bacterium]